jgi:hypothetical protein
MPPFIVRPKEKSEDPNNYSGCNSTPWHPELTVLNLVVDPLKNETISIKGHEYHSARSSCQPHDLTYQSFCKTHVSHSNNALSSIAKTNSRGLDVFKDQGGLESLLPGKVLPLGMRHQSNLRFLNSTKGDLCNPGAGSAWFMLEIPLQLDRNSIRITVAPG